MKPGRELDALVAEKVMGWRLLNLRTEGYSPGQDSRVHNSKPIPPYSTSISAAWEIVKHLMEKGFEIALWGPVDRGFKKNPNWVSEVTNMVTRAWWQSEADTATHAICLAALKAVGYTE